MLTKAVRRKGDVGDTDDFSPRSIGASINTSRIDRRLLTKAVQAVRRKGDVGDTDGFLAEIDRRVDQPSETRR